MRVPWAARRSNQSVLKEINPEYSLEGPMLKLKFQYFVYLMRRTISLKKMLMMGKIEGKRRGWQSMRRLDSSMDSVDMNLSKLQEMVEERGAWHTAGGRNKSDMTSQINNSVFNKQPHTTKYHTRQAHVFLWIYCKNNYLIVMMTKSGPQNRKELCLQREFSAVDTAK